MNGFTDTYKGKKILITGNTGFVGSWLTLWLNSIGAKVYGLSKDVPTIPSLYETAKIDKVVHQRFHDLKYSEAVLEIIKTIQPDFIFHLAAQSLMKDSILYPKNTIQTNVLGTTHLLEILRTLNLKCTVVMVSTDKCYMPNTSLPEYCECDLKDNENPYISSKIAAELLALSYVKSFYTQPKSNVKLSIARIGTIIGGGDWANYRIIPEAYRAWAQNETLIIKRPLAVRQWFHVLDAVSGLLTLGKHLFCKNELNGEIFNFSSERDSFISVTDLMKQMAVHWDKVVWENTDEEVSSDTMPQFISSAKAKEKLEWQSILPIEENIKMVIDWYKHYNQNPTAEMRQYSEKQIAMYTALAEKNIF